MTLKTLTAAAALSLAFAIPTIASAAPVLDGGWSFDEIPAAFTDSTESPISLSLAGPAVFRITDSFITGDTYYVYDFGTLILTTTFQAFASGFGDDASADSAWTSASWSSGEVALSAGSHEITIQGDGVAGTPAGFYTRLDSAQVSEPAVLGLLGLGLVGVWAARRRAA
ncbi:PEP-CTERM sorting domain-containing protein [Futiania mangrovi]|uniref:PEP-CTERM sorting domain-containing protein n=1 Tax=Futiania mangrovi TaxID=2959716 RepID=A0A9J6PB53_9PROT|nr:PEP-CTERM sorting domain-containing protein [Futiania mangrovii]MCP1336389.1 PEP-CTERM sorting domain-containing protein [Futiania mangrovii]